MYFPDVFSRDSLKSTRILASRSDRIESYSKAVYYYEQLFTLEHRRKEILKYSKIQRSAKYVEEDTISHLIKCNVVLEDIESAKAALEYAANGYSNLGFSHEAAADYLISPQKVNPVAQEIPTDWYEKISDWTQAKDAYKKKLFSSELKNNSVHDTNKNLLGYMRSLDSLQDWGTLFETTAKFPQTKHSIQTNAMWEDYNRLIVKACFNQYVETKNTRGLRQPEIAEMTTKMKNSLQYLPENTYKKFLETQYHMMCNNTDKAQESVTAAFSSYGEDMYRFAAESYFRVYPLLVDCQHLAELEEMVKLKSRLKMKPPTTTDLIRLRRMSFYRETANRNSSSVQIAEKIMTLKISSLVTSINDQIENRCTLADRAARKNQHDLAVKLFYPLIKNLSVTSEPEINFNIQELGSLHAYYTFFKYHQKYKSSEDSDYAKSNMQRLVAVAESKREELDRELANETRNDHNIDYLPSARVSKISRDIAEVKDILSKSNRKLAEWTDQADDPSLQSQVEKTIENHLRTSEKYNPNSKKTYKILGSYYEKLTNREYQKVKSLTSKMESLNSDLSKLRQPVRFNHSWRTTPLAPLNPAKRKNFEKIKILKIKNTVFLAIFQKTDPLGVKIFSRLSASEIYLRGILGNLHS